MIYYAKRAKAKQKVPRFVSLFIKHLRYVLLKGKQTEYLHEDIT